MAVSKEQSIFDLRPASENLGAGQTISSIHEIPVFDRPSSSSSSSSSSTHSSLSRPGTELSTNSHTPINITARLHILQHQPTDRPIEDRFSVSVVYDSSTKSSKVLLGVYDGHRGPWTADHISRTLPDDLLSTLSAHRRQSGRYGRFLEDDKIADLFESVDRQILSTFQDAHPIRPPSPYEIPSTSTSQPAKKSILRKVKSMFLKDPKPELKRGLQVIDPLQTEAALAALSGCTASMLLLDINQKHFGSGNVASKIINLGDSRTVITSTTPSSPRSSPRNSTAGVLAESKDVNSRCAAEQAHLIYQHPDDDPKDIFVGGRLFGDTLSTRGFGDAMYKLPLRPPHTLDDSRMSTASSASSSRAKELTDEEKALHRHLVGMMSAHLEAEQHRAAGKKGGKETEVRVPKYLTTVPLIDRYDAMFSRYISPPYVSARPEIISTWTSTPPSPRTPATPTVPTTPTLPITTTTSKTANVLAVLATDGLWDLVSTEEAVSIVREAIAAEEAEPVQQNLAQVLLDAVIQRTGRRPGDDVTILVLTL
ncbi:phosphatase 2C-like domain-containing protein [Diplogelasinospora grovesii]|uniref:Phosphatase 2C-like domain-containing protein n=1 Tax=Diplogelasinospora grovesii TaxID=303347 RepID=A0AAN6N5D9_9PEZI|nr:phosphatase 2C-like domain-containing protein [Diplogelasinospora grovesii]